MTNYTTVGFLLDVNEFVEIFSGEIIRYLKNYREEWPQDVHFNKIHADLLRRYGAIDKIALKEIISEKWVDDYIMFDDLEIDGLDVEYFDLKRSLKDQKFIVGVALPETDDSRILITEDTLNACKREVSLRLSDRGYIKQHDFCVFTIVDTV